MPAIPDRAVFTAVKTFQRDQGLPADGVIKPGDATITALQAAAKQTDGLYIWRTMQDDKVRSTHRDRDGHVFAWDDQPDGGNPGDAFGCRCWVEAFAGDRTTLKRDRAVCFDAAGWKEAVYELLKKPSHENFVTYPYLDSQGKITVGVGFNVDNREEFLNLPFEYEVRSSGKSVTIVKRMATDKEKAIAYDELKYVHKKQREMGKISAPYYVYKKETQVFLSKEMIKSMAMQKIDQFEKDLFRKFPGFECYPSPARRALMDMIYNIGATRFGSHKWKEFFKAVHERNWKKAGQESHRKDVSGERNASTYELFMQAFSLEKEVLK